MREDFLREEVREGYAVSTAIKAYWAVQLELLEALMRVCDTQGLRYFAVYGTLLGAVRHGGFIPWDDDIDIAMPREDYDRLGEISFPAPFFLQTPESDPLAGNVFYHLCDSRTTCANRYELPRRFNKGCRIDILPLDTLAATQKRRAADWREAFQLRRKIERRAPLESFDGGYLPQKMRKALAEGEPLDALYRAQYALCTAHRGGNSGLVGVLGAYNFCPLPKSIFERALPMPFEHLTLPVPVGYKEFIDRIYGGMAAPTPAERQPQHQKDLILPHRPFTSFDARYFGLRPRLAGKKLLVFGAGGFFADFLRGPGRDFTYEALYDNDPAKWGTTLHGLPVKNPATLPADLTPEHALLIVSIYHWEIGEQLEAMGIRDPMAFIPEIDQGFEHPFEAE